MDTYPVENFKDKTIIINKSAYFNPNDFLIPSSYFDYIDKVIISKGLITDRIEKLAEDILIDYNGQEVIFLVILKGAMTFAGHLAQKIATLIKSKSYKLNYKFEYITISSYQNDKSTDDVQIKTDESTLKKLTGKNVIVVEDVYDSGKTLNALYKMFKSTYQPLSLKSVFLIQKMNHENVKFNLQIEYLGFLVPNDFLIGFGIDYNQEFRELEHLCKINANGIDTFRTTK